MEEYSSLFLLLKIQILHLDPEFSVEGTLITGSIGNVKSYIPGKHIAKAQLKSDFGDCTIFTKLDERKCWERSGHI
ncbi:MAG: hypothetical protein ACI9A7_002233 [Cyclobacteriaceae bacterium]|jgi:hypothetical protein